jgi:DnaJ-class molecular chaperone
MRANDCPICDGTGLYPIYDNKGEHRYDIKCPECHGLGKMEEPDYSPNHPAPGDLGSIPL